jgi:DNA-binding CsgD family transcriptional regulator/tetratricopeptide (TPR) repeat protein
MGGRVSSPTFVGRLEELHVLEAARVRAANREPAVVLLGGEAGVGKTRLVAELAERCAAEGTRVLAGGCVPVGDGTLPYGPIIEALRALVADLGAGAVRELIGSPWPQLARLLPALGEPQATGSPNQTTQAPLFEGVLGLLGRLGDQAPVLLVVEDVHWADRSTRELSTFLVRNLRRERIMVIVTYRSDQPGSEPLGTYLVELDRGGPVERIDLPRFQRNEVIAQLTGILDAAPAADLVDAIFVRSEGNPFFTEELLAAVRAGSGELPATLRDLLRGRVEALPEPAQHMLRVAAVAGRRVPHRLLAAVAALDYQEQTEALRTAVAYRLLVTRPGQDSYEFHHGLLQEVVYADLLPSERAGLHAAYARALTDRSELAAGPSAVAAAELAAHWQAAGELADALPATIQAGLAAERVHAFPEAHQHYERALALWDQVPSPAERCGLDRGGLQLRAGVAAGQAGRIERSRVLFADALSQVDRATDPMWAALLLMALGRRHWEGGDEAAGLTALEEAAGLLPVEPSPERARVLGAYAQMLRLVGRIREAAEQSEEALAVARLVGARAEEAHALDLLGCCLADMGEVATGIASLVEARRIAEEVVYPQGIVRACLNLGSLLGRLGRLEESWDVTHRGYAAARRFGIQRALGSFLAANMAMHLIDTGHWEEADHLLNEGLQEEAAAGFRLHRAKGQLETARGNFAAAREHLELARHASPSAAERIGPLLALAELAIWQGRHDDARASLAQAGRWFDTLKANSGRDNGLPWWEIVICYAHGLRLEADCAELARAHRSAAAVDLARRRAEPLIAGVREMTDEREHVTYAPYGLVPHYAAVSEAEFSRLEGRSDPELWRAAAMLWERLPLPYQAAYARFREAEALLTRHGPRSRIEQAIRAADQTADRLGAAPLRREIALLARRGRLQLAEPTDSTPQSTVTPTPAASLGLTRRELQVLRLLADGRSNRQIGQELFITEKTASLHVSRILARLGVASRGEAAAVAHRLNLFQNGP